MALYDQSLLTEQAKIYSENTRHVEISCHPDFQKEFILGMRLE